MQRVAVILKASLRRDPILRDDSNKTNNLGFALIQVLIVTGLIIILGMVFASMLTDSAKVQSLRNSEQDLLRALDLARGAMLNSNTCASVIQDAGHSAMTYVPPTADIIFLQNGATQLLAAGAKYSPKLQITGMQLQPFSDVPLPAPQPPPLPPTIITIPAGSANPPPGTYTQWVLNFALSGAPVDGNGSVRTKTFPVTIYTDAANKIIYCIPKMTAAQSCSSLSMSFNTVTQNCELGICNAANVTPGYTCNTPPPPVSCTAPLYYWVFEGAGTISKPVCLCSRTCY